MDVGRSRRAIVGVLAGVLAGGLLIVAVAGPATAKGPQHVTITPSGGDPVEISNALPPEESESSDAEPGPLFDDDKEPVETDARFARLTEALGIWVVTGEPAALLPEAPAGNLGPELTVEWTMYNPRPDDPDAAPGVVQTLYPVAEGGPLVHTEGGQRYFQRQETADGWFRAPDDLLTTLAAVGVEVGFRTPDVARAGGVGAADGGAAAESPTDEGRSWAVTRAVGAGVVLVVAVGSAVARRRLRTGGTGIPVPAERPPSTASTATPATTRAADEEASTPATTIRPVGPPSATTPARPPARNPAG